MCIDLRLRKKNGKKVERCHVVEVCVFPLYLCESV